MKIPFTNLVFVKAYPMSFGPVDCPRPGRPPRSPRKIIGPIYKPTSVLPSGVTIDCEWDRDARARNAAMSTNVRTPGTVVLIELGFKVFKGFGSAAKIEDKV